MDRSASIALSYCKQKGDLPLGRFAAEEAERRRRERTRFCYVLTREKAEILTAQQKTQQKGDLQSFPSEEVISRQQPSIAASHQPSKSLET